MSMVEIVRVLPEPTMMTMSSAFARCPILAFWHEVEREAFVLQRVEGFRPNQSRWGFVVLDLGWEYKSPFEIGSRFISESPEKTLDMACANRETVVYGFDTSKDFAEWLAGVTP